MAQSRHEIETDRNAEVWNKKPLLRDVYHGFQQRIDTWIDTRIPGRIVEIGSGIGSLHGFRQDTIITDLWLEPWLDLAADAYHLPFRYGSVSHLLLMDVFHHLSAPAAFLEEAARVLTPLGRLVILDPYISAVSAIAYGVFHREPIGWRTPVLDTPSGEYYAAQGNATRLFFRNTAWLRDWSMIHREAFSSFSYLLSGGFSMPALYPRAVLPVLHLVDRHLSKWPRIFAARTLIVLERPRSYGKGATESGER